MDTEVSKLEGLLRCTTCVAQFRNGTVVSIAARFCEQCRKCVRHCECVKSAGESPAHQDNRG